jgi:hypothetical protein
MIFPDAQMSYSRLRRLWFSVTAIFGTAATGLGFPTSFAEVPTQRIG